MWKITSLLMVAITIASSASRNVKNRLDDRFDNLVEKRRNVDRLDDQMGQRVQRPLIDRVEDRLIQRLTRRLKNTDEGNEESITVQGTVDNLAKSQLRSMGCEEVTGEMTDKLYDIAAGKKGLFRAHATSTFKGAWIKCTFSLKSEKKVHFMFSAPYDFNLHDNTLAVAVTPKETEMDAHFMYYETSPYMRKHAYIYDEETPIEVCWEGLCIKGEMTNKHNAKVIISVFEK